MFYQVRLKLFDDDPHFGVWTSENLVIIKKKIGLFYFRKIVFVALILKYTASLRSSHQRFSFMKDFFKGLAFC